MHERAGTTRTTQRDYPNRLMHRVLLIMLESCTSSLYARIIADNLPVRILEPQPTSHILNPRTSSRDTAVRNPVCSLCLRFQRFCRFPFKFVTLLWLSGMF